MKTTLRTLFAAALTLVSAAAMAAPGDRGERDWRGHDQRTSGPRDWRGDRHAPAPRYDARPVVVRPAPNRYYAPRYAPPRGYYRQDWRRGHYLPVQYRARPYVIDWRAYRLAPPPWGYQYVRVDDRAVLIAISNGLIANVVNDLFYR